MRPRAQRVHEGAGVGRGAAPGVDVERALAHGRELAGADGAARGLGERQQVDDDVGLRAAAPASSSVPWTPSRARRATPTTSQSKAASIVASVRPIDAEAEDEDAQVRGVAELDELPVPARLLLGDLARALGVGQDRGHHPLGHRAVARPARAAQGHAVGNAVGDPVDAGRQHLHDAQRRHLVQRRQVLPARDDELDVAAGLGDDLDPGRRAGRARRGRRPRPSRRGQHARERRAQALEEVGDLAVVAVEVARALGGRDRVARCGRCARARGRSAPTRGAEAGSSSVACSVAVTSAPRSPARWWARARSSRPSTVGPSRRACSSALMRGLAVHEAQAQAPDALPGVRVLGAARRGAVGRLGGEVDRAHVLVDARREAMRRGALALDARPVAHGAAGGARGRRPARRPASSAAGRRVARLGVARVDQALGGQRVVALGHRVLGGGHEALHALGARGRAWRSRRTAASRPGPCARRAANFTRAHCWMSSPPPVK